MATSNKRKRYISVLSPLIAVVAFVGLWEIICRGLDIKEYLVPAPSVIAVVFWNNFNSLMVDLRVTSVEAILGFLLANVLSLVVAIWFALSPISRRAFYPHMVALKSIPVIAIAPLLVIWFGYGMMGKVIMAAIIAFFPLVVNATLGLTDVDPDALVLMNSLSAKKLDILFKLRFPNAVPHIFSALKISTSLSVVGAIVAELTGAKRGLGFTILMASYNVDTPLLFCAIILASLTGMAFFGLVCLCEATIGKKYIRSN